MFVFDHQKYGWGKNFVGIGNLATYMVYHPNSFILLWDIPFTLEAWNNQTKHKEKRLMITHEFEIINGKYELVSYFVLINYIGYDNNNFEKHDMRKEDFIDFLYKNKDYLFVNTQQVGWNNETKKFD